MMLKGVFLNEEEVENLQDLIDNIDIETGSLVNKLSDREDVLDLIRPYLNKIHRLISNVNKLLGNHN